MDENSRLKAELRKRALDSLSDIGQLGEQSAEINHLKAEVERLRASSFVTAVPVEQYERVIKAGDELGEWFMDIHPSKKKWNAAKEGNAK